MNKTEILNGKITSTKLGEEHGCLTADLLVEGAGWGLYIWWLLPRPLVCRNWRASFL